jgi:hypothetical protein
MMARGWESKAIEAQQEVAATRPESRPAVAPHEAAHRARLATLTLARTRANADLEAATASAHRTMLQQAIADLDRQIADLTS